MPVSHEASLTPIRQSTLTHHPDHPDPGKNSPKGRPHPWIAVWGVALIAGFTVLQAYENRPSPEGFSSAHWPGEPGTPGKDLDFRAPDRPTVLVFAHPGCPCTDATLEELDRLIARAGPGKAAVHVFFYCPAGEPDSFAETPLRRRAERVPDVQVALDRGGRLAKAFGAASSGQVLVYEPDGRLRFRGGITGSRGHAGPNRGADAVLAILQGGPSPEMEQAPVFGCGLEDASAGPAVDPTSDPVSSNEAGP